WRERLEPGIYRSHKVACSSTADRRAGRRCGCVLQLQVPGISPGRTRFVAFAGTVTEARAERRRLPAAGRPEPRAAQSAVPVTLDALAAAVFRARSPGWAANTVRNREDDYVRRIAPTLGGRPLEEVGRAHVEAWLAELIASGASRRA